jgi:hypothetical protein
MKTTSGYCLCRAIAFSYEGAPERAHATAHVFVGEQLSWFDTADDLPRYETTRRNAKPIRHGPRK